MSGSFARLWLPVVAWAAVIFAFSSVPDLGTGLGGWDLVLRKIAHAAEYAVLGALVAVAPIVGTLRVVRPGQLDRISGVPQLLEVDALDHPPGVDVQAGDHADRERHARVSLSASSRVNRPS